MSVSRQLRCSISEHPSLLCMITVCQKEIWYWKRCLILCWLKISRLSSQVFFLNKNVWFESKILVWNRIILRSGSESAACKIIRCDPLTFTDFKQKKLLYRAWFFGNVISDLLPCICETILRLARQAGNSIGCEKKKFIPPWVKTVSLTYIAHILSSMEKSSYFT